jgi:hypothetical protein
MSSLPVNVAVFFGKVDKRPSGLVLERADSQLRINCWAIRSVCCARAATGHRAAPPSPAMNCRRRISHPSFLDRQPNAAGAACLALRRRSLNLFCGAGGGFWPVADPSVWRAMSATGKSGHGWTACRTLQDLVGRPKNGGPQKWLAKPGFWPKTSLDSLTMAAPTETARCCPLKVQEPRIKGRG